jgi:hypothetical protein
MGSRNLTVALAATGALTVGAVVLGPALAAADPVPPPPPPGDPALPPPPPAPVAVPMLGEAPNGLNVLGQTGDPAPGPLGLPNISGLDETTVLGQNAAPSAPGAGPGVVPNLRAFNNAYGPQQNLVPSAPGEGEQFDVAPGEENADVNARTWMGRYIDMYRAGMLKGGLLGQTPQEQLGEPLPGTAPPPGTNIPAGLGQFLPGPEDVPPAEGPPPPPG